MGVVVGLVTFAVGVIVVFVVGLGAGGIMISSLRVMMKLSKTQSACNVV
jgi:hypothetical protein